MKKNNYYRSAFTLIEILIVITILAILALTIVPSFVGLDREARISATKSNLEAIRSSITFYRAKLKKYPAKLEDLASDTFIDAGVTRTFLDKIPIEQISEQPSSNQQENRNEVVNSANMDDMYDTGPGWFYHTKTARVYVNWKSALDPNVWDSSDSPGGW